MPNSEIPEGNIPKKMDEVSIKQRIRNNPILYILIITGIVTAIVGFLIPLLDWLFDPEVPSADLAEFSKHLGKIQKEYQKTQEILEKIVEQETYRWSMNNHERELLRKLSQQKKSALSVMFYFFLLLVEGAFFFLLGLWIERKVISKRRLSGNSQGEGQCKK